MDSSVVLNFYDYKSVTFLKIEGQRADYFNDFFLLTLAIGLYIFNFPS